MRDMDFGRQLIRCFEDLRWPEGVVVEDLSYSAPLVLHRLQELDPATLVLVGAAPRGLDPPGTLRRYSVDLRPPGPEDVRRCLEESVQGTVDIDHTLAIARHWGGLPAETIVIEVEPADCSFGVGFSDELAASIDPILTMVREELGCTQDDADRHFDAELEAAQGCDDDDSSSEVGAVAPSEALLGLMHYAQDHEHARLVHPRRGLPLLNPSSDRERVVWAGRSRPLGVRAASGGDWFDVIPLEDGWLAVVVGDVAGRGVEAAGQMADLRAAVRAYAILEGTSPARVLAHLDRLVHATGLGETATFLYIALHPDSGELRMSNGGHCPALVLPSGIDGCRFLGEARSGPLGTDGGAPRPEATLALPRGSTLLLFTDGLVASHTKPIRDGLEDLRRAATTGPSSLEELCDHVLAVCADGLSRDDDLCLLALRLLAAGRSSPSRHS